MLRNKKNTKLGKCSCGREATHVYKCPATGCEANVCYDCCCQREEEDMQDMTIGKRK